MHIKSWALEYFNEYTVFLVVWFNEGCKCKRRSTSVIKFNMLHETGSVLDEVLELATLLWTILLYFSCIWEVSSHVVNAKQKNTHIMTELFIHGNVNIRYAFLVSRLTLTQLFHFHWTHHINGIAAWVKKSRKEVLLIFCSSQWVVKGHI